MRRATPSEDAVDNEQETAGGGVSRGQNQLHVIPEDWHVAGNAIAPFTERCGLAGVGTELLAFCGELVLHRANLIAEFISLTYCALVKE